MGTEPSTDLAPLNWALLHWPVAPALVVVIRDGADEVWTARSLRIALMQLAMQGRWNADEEARSESSFSAREVYRQLPSVLTGLILDPVRTIAETAARLARAASALPEGDAHIALSSLEELSEKAWEIWAALAAERNVEIRIGTTNV